MIRLNSSAIRGVDYNPVTRRLYIWFPNNGPYTYYRVPEHIFRGLISSSSPGTYYRNHIQGRYTA